MSTTAAAAPSVLSEMKGSVKWIWFNRPQVKNALTPEVADQMRAEIEKSVQEGARVVVISGQGRRLLLGRRSEGGGPAAGRERQREGHSDEPLPSAGRGDDQAAAAGDRGGRRRGGRALVAISRWRPISGW